MFYFLTYRRRGTLTRNFTAVFPHTTLIPDYPLYNQPTCYSFHPYSYISLTIFFSPVDFRARLTADLHIIHTEDIIQFLTPISIRIIFRASSDTSVLCIKRTKKKKNDNDSKKHTLEIRGSTA